MKKTIVKIISFCLLLVLLTGVFWRVFQYRFADEDGIEGMKNFYKTEENTIDVMFFGSSHMFVDVNTAVLWDEYGMAAYNLGGTEQPLWNTYFFMKEALKTQKPELLVVDCYGATMASEYQEQSGIIKNTFGMKFSPDKIEAVKVSAPDNRLLYLLGYPGFHGRYNALSSADFLPGKGIVGYDTWKGHHFMGEINESIAAIQPQAPETVADVEVLTEKNETYLREIINLAKEKKIPLLLINTPYCVTDREQAVYNRVAQIAEETGVPYINFNLQYEELGLDFATDFADGHHLNYLGTPKFTRAIADYIKANYEIPVRTGVSGYEDYDVMAQLYFQTVSNQQVRDEFDLEAYLSGLTDENYIIAYTLSGDYESMANVGIIRDKLATYGIDLSAKTGDQAWVVNQGTKEVLFASDNAAEYEYHTSPGTYDVLMVKSPEEKELKEGIYVPVINFNNTIYDPVYQGLTVFVYDTETETMVEAAGFYLENGMFCPVKWRE